MHKIKRLLLPCILSCQSQVTKHLPICLLYTSDAADDMQCVDLGGRRIIKKVHAVC